MKLLAVVNSHKILSFKEKCYFYSSGISKSRNVFHCNHVLFQQHHHIYCLPYSFISMAIQLTSSTHVYFERAKCRICFIYLTYSKQDTISFACSIHIHIHTLQWEMENKFMNNKSTFITLSITMFYSESECLEYLHIVFHSCTHCALAFRLTKCK